MNPLFRIDFSISDSLKIVRKSVLIYETIIENLGFTYQELDDYIRQGIEPTAEVKQKIDELHQKNEFKMRSMPRFNPIIF